jgi:hypothetical protein
MGDKKSDNQGEYGREHHEWYQTGRFEDVKDLSDY